MGRNWGASTASQGSPDIRDCISLVRFVDSTSSTAPAMAVRKILLLGNPALRVRCKPVKSCDSDESRGTIRDLADTLADFRSRRGFGRGIAAPQIGSLSRVIYLDFEHHGPLINPNIVRRSKETFRLWDDCFSFPDILVKLARHTAVTVSYQDAAGEKRTLDARGALSELLQHEIDHIDGILAIDRAVDSRHIILRSEYEQLTRKSGTAL